MLGILVIVNVNEINHVILVYLDYENCKCRKRLIDKLVDECDENINEVEITQAKNECSSSTLYIVLLSIFFIISIGISIYFAYFYYYLKKYNAHAMLDTRTETPIY